jgi:hypothetical protein
MKETILLWVIWFMGLPRQMLERVGTLVNHKRTVAEELGMGQERECCRLLPDKAHLRTIPRRHKKALKTGVFRGSRW